MPDNKRIKKDCLGKRLSSGNMAKIYGVTRVTVCRHLRRLGITRPESGVNSRNRRFDRKQYRSGYPVTFSPDHPRANHLGYVFDHLLVMEKAMGKTPIKGKPIHHIDMDRMNYNIKNLHLCKSNSEHQQLHSSLDKVVSKLIKNGIIKFKDGKYYA